MELANMKRYLRIFAAFCVMGLGNCPPTFAHWPDQPAHQIARLGEFTFEHGGVIRDLRMSYVTHGTLNPDKSNAVLLLHGGGANHHLFDHLIGPGRAFDTDRNFIVVPDTLGNTQTGFEHSSSPTGSGLKMRFPAYNARDMVRAEYRLVTEALGVSHLLAVGGISMGAMKSVQFAVSYPDFMDGLLPISGGAASGTQRFFRARQMLSILEHCAGWNGGHYDENPSACAANAIAVLIPYFYSREWWEQNIDTPDAYERWRIGWGDYYLDIQDARDLYYLVKSFGLGWIGNTPGFNDDTGAALRSIRARTLFIYSPHDQFFLPKHIEFQLNAIPNARALSVDSVAGHLICCNGDPQATHIISEAIKRFLQELLDAPE